jgi:hypothetical protein
VVAMRRNEWARSPECAGTGSVEATMAEVGILPGVCKAMQTVSGPHL